jgi:anhydro-N-acetylmuramic acid kinase
MASSGVVIDSLLQQLNQLDYYRQPFPKSLANEFGIEVVYPLIKLANVNLADAMATYCVHIAEQIKNALLLLNEAGSNMPTENAQLLITGGGAHHKFLVKCITAAVSTFGISVVVPAENIINYKEALIMAFIGVLRFRQENNVLSSVTGSTMDSVGGAMWSGQSA